MKKAVIAVLVGAIILFLWQTISHIALGNVLHSSMMKEAPNGEQILAAMQGAEGGMYSYPVPIEGESMEEMNERMKGKPSFGIIYSSSWEWNMPLKSTVGLILNLLAVWIVVCMLGYARERMTTFGKRWWGVMLFALFLIIMHYLMAWNWMDMPADYIMQESIDTLIAWALVGLWLAWYLGRDMAPAKTSSATM